MDILQSFSTELELENIYSFVCFVDQGTVVRVVQFVSEG